MKIRFSNNDIVFRISKTELSILETQKQLSHHFILPDHTTLYFEILLSNDRNQKNLHFNNNHTVLTLTLPIKILEDLKKTPSKEGIMNTYTVEAKTHHYVFQIDLIKEKL